MWWKLIEKKKINQKTNNNLWPLPLWDTKFKPKPSQFSIFQILSKEKKKNIKQCHELLWYAMCYMYHNKAWNWLIYTRNKMLLKIDCAINNWCIILCSLMTIKRIAHNVAFFLNIIQFTQLLFTMWTWCV